LRGGCSGSGRPSVEPGRSAERARGNDRTRALHVVGDRGHQLVDRVVAHLVAKAFPELDREGLKLREGQGQLKGQIAWLQKQLFGGGKSEKLDRAQLLLKLNELEKLAAATRPVQTITYERGTPRERPLRRTRPG